tara:strand:- start:27369 stop:27641 length:273 start_codon:yes stop_codon:yes gene_type:complete
MKTLLGTIDLAAIDIPPGLVDRIDERIRMHTLRLMSDTESPSLMEDDNRHIEAQIANLSVAQAVLLRKEAMDWAQELIAGVVRKLVGIPI